MDGWGRNTFSRDEPDRWAGPDDDPWRYALWAQVEGGAEGQIWRGTMALGDGNLDVAVKVLSPQRFGGLENPQQVARRWSDQAARLRQLNHPGIVSVQEAFIGAPPHPRREVLSGQPTPYFVMAWVDGLNLISWVARKPPLPDRLAILVNVADALDHLHATGQVHGDIKPSNLLVTRRRLPTGPALESAVLVDFGLMRAVTGEPPSVVSGTPGYWAPELFTGKPYSGASDLYGFAGVVLFLLTGSHPIMGPAAEAHARDQLVAAGTPPAVVEAVSAALHPDADRRPSNGINAWLAAARSGLSSSAIATEGFSPSPQPGRPQPFADTTRRNEPPPTPSPAPAPPAPTTPPTRSRRGLVIALIAALIGALAAASTALALTKGGGSSSATSSTTSVPSSSTTSASPTTTQTLPGSSTTSAPPTSPSANLPTLSRLIPQRVTATATAAPATDASGRLVTYDPQFATDGLTATAWRPPEYQGVGHALTLDFGRQVTVRRVGLLPGYAKIDPVSNQNWFFINRRVARVDWIFDGGATMSQTFRTDAAVVQYLDIPPIPSRQVVMKITEVTPHGGLDFVAVSEVEVYGS